MVRNRAMAANAWPASWAATAVAVTLALGGASTQSHAAEYETYLRVSAERDTDNFNAHDRDGDGRVTQADVRGNVDFEARFDDFDIDRNGVITREELARYIRIHYRVGPAGQ